MLPATASAFEVFYSLVAIVSLVLALANLLFAGRGSAATRAETDVDPAEHRSNILVARQGVYNHCALVGVQSGAVGLGLIALTLPPNPAAGTGLTLVAGLLVLWITVWADVSIITQFISNARFAQLERDRNHE